MGFSVDVAALALLPAHLDRLSDDAARSRSYVDDHTDLAGGEGIFNLILGGHRTAVSSTCDFFGQTISPHARAYAERVREVVRYYSSTDLKSAARVDATIPAAADHQPLLPQPGRWPGLFADDAEPTDLLVKPADHRGDYPHHLRLTDILSPTSLARDAVVEVTRLATRLGLLDRPYDPFSQAAQPWLGDWAGLLACADAFTALSGATAAMALNVRHGALSTQAVWSGNAADGCVSSLGRLHSSLAATPDPLRRLADEYRHAAEEIHKLSHACAGLLVEVIDLAVMTLFEVHAAALTAETLIGPIVLGAFIADNVRRIYRLTHEINALIRTAEDLAKLAGTNLERLRIEPQKLPHLSTALPDLPK